jgi:hypothetical protein
MGGDILRRLKWRGTFTTANAIVGILMLTLGADGSHCFPLFTWLRKEYQLIKRESMEIVEIVELSF